MRTSLSLVLPHNLGCRPPIRVHSVSACKQLVSQSRSREAAALFLAYHAMRLTNDLVQKHVTCKCVLCVIRISCCCQASFELLPWRTSSHVRFMLSVRYFLFCLSTGGPNSLRPPCEGCAWTPGGLHLWGGWVDLVRFACVHCRCLFHDWQHLSHQPICPVCAHPGEVVKEFWWP